MGDIACKKASLSTSIQTWGLSLLAYNLMLFAWFMAIRNTKAITITGTVWLLAGQITLVIVGHCMGESLTIYQKAGIGLSLVSAFLLSQ